MRYKIIPIFMVIISIALSILATSNLSIGKGYQQAPAGWLYYMIWSLAIVSIISYFICKSWTKSWRKLTRFIIQLIMTIILYIMCLFIIPWAFISPLSSDYNTILIFRPLSHAVQAPVISVSILENSQPYTELKQEIHFFGFLGYSKTPTWENNRYIYEPENDPSTLEYALYTDNKIDFINKFQAILDARFDGTVSTTLKPLVINNNKFGSNIAKLLPKQDSYNAVDIMLALGELDLIDKISGALSSKIKWLSGAIFIDLKGDQLYHYYRLAKDHDKVRFVDDRYSSFYYAGDYFGYAVKYCDSDLINDLIKYGNKPRSVYLIFALDNISKLSTDAANYNECFNTIKSFINAKSFDEFSQELTGKKKIDFFGRYMSDIGLAAEYNSADISPAYNVLLDESQQKMPEIYNYMIEKGYNKVAKNQTTE